MERCPWAEGFDLYRQYHDSEWGVPLRDDRRLFELLILEGAQAGLSWATILKKRDNYRRAFDGFDPARIAHYDDSKVAALLADAGHSPQSCQDRRDHSERPGLSRPDRRRQVVQRLSLAVCRSRPGAP